MPSDLNEEFILNWFDRTFACSEGLGLKGNVCGALAAGIFALGLRFYWGRRGHRDSALNALLQKAGIGDNSLNRPTTPVVQPRN
jgi:hypothetical protein